MKRQIFTVLISFFLFLSFAVPAVAQMSDAAVAEYVKSGVAAGKSQTDIAKELVARGVTREQVERIRRNYESQSKDDSGLDATRLDNRMRASDSDPADVMPETEEPMFQAEDLSNIFGHSIFTTRNLTFAPSQNLPTPENYKLGPGDEVIIDIWGANQATIRKTISPEGTINVPDLGIISINGMTVKEADSYMKRMLGRIYSVDGDDAKSEIKLTLGNIRTIQVNVMGEVAVPGTYRLSSFSNAYHALYRAGGVSRLGSLRGIRLCRKGKTIATLDVYEFIFHGNTEDTILEEGDIIIVPTYDMLVEVNGNVKRPMLYEMKEGETLKDLFGYAGGFAGNAYRSSVGLIRRNGKEYQVFTVNEDKYSGFGLKDGDVINVGAMLDRYENKIEIKGAVYRPGTYQLGDEISTVGQLIAKADGLTGDAFTNRALLQREKEDLTLEVLPVDVKAITDGSAEDIRLRKNDVLFIASVHDLNDVGTITVSGEVARPGEFVFAENTTLEDIIMQAGGLLESASLVKVDVSRRMKDPSGTEATETLAELFTFGLKDGFVIDGESNFVLEPYDQVYVRRSPGYKPQAHVQVGGEILFPGRYALSSREERISDVISKAGGVLPWAYVKGARLRRVANDEEKERMMTLANLASKDNSRDSLGLNKFDITDRYYVGINLEAALKNPGCEADMVLRDGDYIEIPEMISTVTISGNVMYPNVVSYDSDMSVKDYVAMAGGYGFRSKKTKAYIIYLNGTVGKARRNSKKLVEPGCEIVVPEKRARENSLSEVLGIATTATSLATMMATLGNLIK